MARALAMVPGVVARCVTTLEYRWHTGRMRVLVAMSGGVDSSVAAALLVEQGHDVVGATLKLWGGPSDSGCCSVADVDDARRVAQQLGIDHHVFNLTEEFDRHVVGALRGGARRTGGRPTPVLSATGPSSSTGCWSDPTAWDSTAWPPGTTPGSRTGSLPPPARRRRRQGPVLRALHAGPGRAGPGAVPGGGDDQGRRAGARSPAWVCARRTSPTARTCASSAAWRAGRASCRPARVPPGRRGQRRAARRWGRSRPSSW